jgi:uncharacterized protein YjiS (DUF1127 family)
MSGYAHPSLTNSRLPRAGALARPGAALLARLSNTVGEWRRRLRDREALENLTDRELADFGASRADVYREVSAPFWRSPPPC